LEGAFITMNSSRRFFKIVLISVLVVAVLLLTSVKFFSIYAEKKITEKLDAARCTFKTLDLDLLSRSVHVTELNWKYESDSAQQAPHQIHFAQFSAKGIGVLRYLWSGELRISKITADDGDILYNRALKIPPSNENASRKIQVDQIDLSRSRIQLTSDTVAEYSAALSCTLKNIRIDEDAKFNFEILSVKVLADHLVLQRSGSLYNTTISRLYLNSEEEKIEVDSLIMNPLKEKYEFANSLGKQKTRIVLQLPSIRMEGFALEKLQDSIFSVSIITIEKADLSVFRDKRLPFKNPLIPLPMQMLKEEIPFGLKLDTIRILHSKIVHEEIAEAGSEIGKINFSELNATLSNFNNRRYDDRPAFATVTASSKFMSTGFIDASFFMPVEKGSNYEARGKILHLNLQEINTITEAVGFLRIESGFMNRLNFKFYYNEKKSHGALDINYENLKMVSLNKKEKKNEINQFKTILINLLVRKDKNKDTPKGERTGVIDVERDPRRFVVNLWVISLFDGLKAAVLPDVQEEPKK
jgi:hypothetical protein